MVSEWSDAKMYYNVTGGERILTVHQFRSRVQNERERRSQMRAKWREGVKVQYVAVHRCCGESRFSTPEIWAHDYVRMGRSVGTSATKKNIHVAPSEYVHFTPFG